MLKHRPVMTGMALVMLLVAGNPAFADRERVPEQRRPDSTPRTWNPSPDRNAQDWRGNDRRDMDRGYSQYRETRRPGFRVNELPRHHVVVPYRNTRYYYDGGLWYRPFGSFFEVSLPPVGLSISLLPPYYSTIWAGGVPYYLADGVYYAWRPNERNYVVVEPPAGTQTEIPQPERLFIYPREGQSEAQQADDRYACHRWAVEQTGFDPANQNGQTADQSAYRPDDYQRASRACLESRGYSVR